MLEGNKSPTTVFSICCTEMHICEVSLWGSLQKLTCWPQCWERVVRRGMFWQYLLSWGFILQCDNRRASDTQLCSLSLPRRRRILKHLRFHHVNLNQTLSQWSRFFTLPGESINTWPSGTIHSCKVAIFFRLSITWQIITRSIQLSCATCTNGNGASASALKTGKKWIGIFRGSGSSAAEVEKGQGDDGPVGNVVRFWDISSLWQGGGGKRSGGADAHGNPGWKDLMFSLPKEKKCFYKVMWVYKEKAACWQRNIDYSLDACQSPEMCPPSLPLSSHTPPSPQEAITQNTVD